MSFSFPNYAGGTTNTSGFFWENPSKNSDWLLMSLPKGFSSYFLSYFHFYNYSIHHGDGPVFNFKMDGPCHFQHVE